MYLYTKCISFKILLIDDTARYAIQKLCRATNKVIYQSTARNYFIDKFEKKN